MNQYTPEVSQSLALILSLLDKAGCSKQLHKVRKCINSDDLAGELMSAYKARAQHKYRDDPAPPRCKRRASEAGLDNAGSVDPAVPGDALAEARFLVEYLTASLERVQHLRPRKRRASRRSVSLSSSIQSSTDRPSSASSDDERALYCMCRTPSSGDMVACDNSLCPYEWFHLGCLAMSKFPKGKWYCPPCRKAMGIAFL